MTLVRKTFDLDGLAFECCALVDQQIHFRLKDVARILGYSSELSRARKLVEDKWKSTWSLLKERFPQQQTTVQFPDSTLFVSEPGVYSLLFRSRKYEAKRFADHLFDVVLPALRQTGAETPRSREKLELQEKDELLTETKRALEEAYEMLARAREEFEEKNRTETLKDTMLTETRNALVERSRMLESEVRQKRQLQDDMATVRKRVAVVPKRRSVRHSLCVYRHENVYKVIRAQKRGLKKSIKRIPREFTLVYSDLDVPNPFHLINRLKEILPKSAFKYNTITSDLDIVGLIRQCREQ